MDTRTRRAWIFLVIAIGLFVPLGISYVVVGTLWLLSLWGFTLILSLVALSYYARVAASVERDRMNFAPGAYGDDAASMQLHPEHKPLTPSERRKAGKILEE